MDTMASLINRIKFFILNRQKVGRVVTPALALALVILVLRWANNSSPGDLNLHDPGVKFTRLDYAEIISYLDAMKDSRPESCKLASYVKPHKHKISIILDFHEHQFYDLKLTLESIIRHTPDDLYEEIILLDDGSGQETIRKDAAAFLADPKFKKLKGFRSDKSEGSSLSRFKASKVATGSIIVFLSSEVAVNQGWLEPLVDLVVADPHVIAIPHFDSLLSGARFFITPDNLVNIFSWSLTTLAMESEEQDRYLSTPVMTGHAFAVGKDFLDSIGSFDEGMEKGNGENLELGIRTWLCGGSLKIVTCSRMAQRNALEPLEVKSARNFRRIAELWFDEYKNRVYRHGKFPQEQDETEKISLRTRRQYLQKITTCKSIGSYLSDAAKDLVIPSGDAKMFGKLRSKTGYCVRNDDASSGDIAMAMCRPHMYEPHMVYEHDFKGRFRIASKCLQLHDNFKVTLEQCEFTKKEQLWNYTPAHNIQNSLYPTKCLKQAVIEGEKHEEVLGTGDCPEEQPEEEEDRTLIILPSAKEHFNQHL